MPDTESGFSDFWRAWPTHYRKAAKRQCLAKWIKYGCAKIAPEIVAHVEAMKRSDAWTKQDGAFIPAPVVYLNQSRWEAPLPPECAIATINHVARTTEYLSQQAAHFEPTPEKCKQGAERARELKQRFLAR